MIAEFGLAALWLAAALAGLQLLAGFLGMRDGGAALAALPRQQCRAAHHAPAPPVLAQHRLDPPPPVVRGRAAARATDGGRPQLAETLTLTFAHVTGRRFAADDRGVCSARTPKVP